MKRKLKPVDFPPLGLYTVRVQIPPGYLDSGKMVQVFCSLAYASKKRVGFWVLQKKQSYLPWIKNFDIVEMHKGKFSHYHLIDDYYFE